MACFACRVVAGGQTSWLGFVRARGVVVCLGRSFGRRYHDGPRPGRNKVEDGARRLEAEVPRKVGAGAGRGFRDVLRVYSRGGRLSSNHGHIGNGSDLAVRAGPSLGHCQWTVWNRADTSTGAHQARDVVGQEALVYVQIASLSVASLGVNNQRRGHGRVARVHAVHISDLEPVSTVRPLERSNQSVSSPAQQGWRLGSCQRQGWAARRRRGC